MREPVRFVGWFDTQCEAINHAHKCHKPVFSEAHSDTMIGRR